MNVTVDRHRDLHMILWPNLPPGNVTNVQPTVTHESMPQITWNASTDPEGDEVYYRLIINDTVSDIVDIVTQDTFYNLTVQLKYSLIYNVSIYAFDEWLWEGNTSSEKMLPNI